ncbi:hypothetical protein [Alloalcanivorax mobilis]|uniref:hypothetical protein n=1 Tax=Alloalcanivorax mobilis TaxID=2019569 RepID=UPI000B5B3025|nr:hypothetical protein [Alloalcanivorax mobilis]ASK34741.1 hypothetical protein CEK62_10285 [Alcanivorax sp. N3-2A]|tara:strand:+ start:6701 stop:6940 length:240 start_codon:yes stop_codon:yes gene_type:complete
MLLKYLNDLDNAVREADRNPCPAALSECAERLAVVDGYLASQIEPVRRRGREIVDGLVSTDLYARLRQPMAPSEFARTL